MKCRALPPLRGYVLAYPKPAAEVLLVSEPAGMINLAREIPAPEPAGPVRGTVRVPGSKSLTNRYLVLAALAQGPSVLRGVLDSRDSRLMIQALTALGAVVEHTGPDTVRITPLPDGGAVRPISRWGEDVMHREQEPVTVWVRTKTAGTKWSDWEYVPSSDGHGPDAGTSEATSETQAYSFTPPAPFRRSRPERWPALRPRVRHNPCSCPDA